MFMCKVFGLLFVASLIASCSAISGGTSNYDYIWGTPGATDVLLREELVHKKVTWNSSGVVSYTYTVPAAQTVNQVRVTDKKLFKGLTATLTPALPLTGPATLTIRFSGRRAGFIKALVEIYGA